MGTHSQNGPFSLYVILRFMHLVSVVIPILLIHGNALFYNLCEHNPHIYPELCLFVVLETYPSEILLVT